VNNNKNPEGLKADSAMSPRSSSHTADGRSSTTRSSSSANSGTSSKEVPTTARRNSDWRSVKRSVKELWKSVVGV
jgi:hypothetical protein